MLSCATVLWVTVVTKIQNQALNLMQTAIFPVKHREKLVLSRFHTKKSYRVTIFSINAESTMFIADGNRNL